MSIWGRVFAAGYDKFMAKSERDCFVGHRRTLLQGASGDVLEIGGGTGANLAFYNGSVRTLTITEPEQPMAKRLERHIAERRPDARLLRAPAEDLPFDDASFDVAVSTLVLCTVEDEARALDELRRVLRPGGKLLFMEHVRSDDAKVAKRQDRLHPFHVRFAHGCHCNRPTVDAIRRAGFEVTDLVTDSIPHAPEFVRPLVVGTARI